MPSENQKSDQTKRFIQRAFSGSSEPYELTQDAVDHFSVVTRSAGHFELAPLLRRSNYLTCITVTHEHKLCIQHSRK